MILVKEKIEIKEEFHIYPVKVRIARAIKDCTLEELAKEANLTRRTVTKIEKGNCKSISKETFQKLIKALGQNEKYFMTDV